MDAEVEEGPATAPNLLGLPNLREQGYRVAAERVAGFERVTGSGVWSVP